MARGQGMGFVRSFLGRTRSYGIRLSHRFTRLEPLDSDRPGVVVTGAGGTIGRVLREGLAGDYSLRTIDQFPGPGVDLVADVRQVGRMEAAFAGAEAVARYYAAERGLSVICLRIGTVNRQDAPRNARERATLLTHRDLVQLVRRCLEAPPDLSFGVFYGVSRNTWRIWDIDEAASILGFEPLDDAARFR